MIGWSEKDINPKKSSLQAVYERISEYVETPISVTAMAVESEVIRRFCSVLLNVSSEMVEMARRK